MKKAVDFFYRIAVKFRRAKWFRTLEDKLRFPNKRFAALGEANHSFFRPGWETFDIVDADYLLDMRKDPLPIPEGIIDAVYASHLIEHIDFQASKKLFQEAYRVLKPGGTIRLVTPDMDILLDRYRQQDWTFFLINGGKFVYQRICEGVLPAESLLIHNRLVGWFASYSGRLDTAGGPLTTREVVDRKLSALSKYEFREWCVSLLEPGRVYAHIHLYDYEELRSVLSDVGFHSISKVDFAQSNCEAMLQPPIDLESHRPYSLYVEAKK